MISVRNLTKRFGEVVAVSDASFDVKAGEVMGFLGPNGAGKTTAIRVLTGYLPASSGTVRIDDLDVLKDSLAVRERIGYLPETVPLYLEMRVEEYLRFRALLKGVGKDRLRENVGRSMEQCGLTHMARRLVGQLSKGYRQRVGLADALVHRPPILILDEPTGGLDPQQRKEVLEMIRRLGREHTILLSSHVLAEVESISDRVMIIQRGKLLAVGRPAELAQELQEAPRVLFEVRATLDEVRHALQPLLSALPEDLSGEAVDAGWIRCSVRPASGTDPRAELADRLRNAELPLRELRRVEFTLEELFLRITAQAASEAARGR